MAKPIYDPSPDRQSLHHLVTELSGILEAFCRHQPLLQGSLRKLSRRCGKPRCRCAQGEPHSTTVFVDRRGERPTLRKVSSPEYRRLLVPTREYQKLRDRRARLSRLHQEVLRTCDRLTKYRLAQGSRLHSLPKGSP